MLMPFGKFKGVTLESLPDDYLGWLLTRELRDHLREALLRESDRREGVAPVVVEIRKADIGLMRLVIDLGYRAAARTIHPDCGGDPERMVRLNALVEFLRNSLPEDSDE